MSSGKYVAKGLGQNVGSGGTGRYDPNIYGQTITLSSLDSINVTGAPSTISLQDLFITDPSWHPDIKKYEGYELPEDVLALSVAWKRLKDNNFRPNFSSVLDRQLFEFCNEHDRMMASSIRDYYSKKIMMLSLKNDRPLTKFRKDLSKFIQTNGKLIEKKDLGMVYYLPYFYQYDCELDYVKSVIDTHPEWMNIPRKIEKDITKHLTPIKKIIKNQKRVKTAQYWFKDDDNVAVMFQFDVSNPLLHMWDYSFDNVSKLEIFGTFSSFNIDNMSYYSSNKWKLVRA